MFTLPALPSVLVVAAWYGFWSIITALAYWLDKASARGGRWRTPERRLHVLAVLGGWPGALLAQYILRHKTRKQSFQAVFALTLVLNLALVGALIWISPGCSRGFSLLCFRA